MLSELLKIIATKFKDMPKPVRIGTYVLLVLVFVYLLLLPRFIYGECFLRDVGGGEIPLRGHIVSSCIAGQAVKIKINEDGIWAFPVISRIPKNLELKFWHEGKSYPIMIKFYSPWLTKQHKVYFDPTRDTPFYLAQQGGAEGVVTRVLAWIKKSISVQDAYAQDITEVKRRVYRVLSEVLNVPQTRIQPNKSIREDLRADTIACIKIVVALENEFGIKIPDEQWERLYTVQHIIDYVYNRLGE